ncbi:MAG: peptide chain release factor 2 [Alphaproteobacteria bacterium]|nr:peptide chain release factor 2 [Alphaproteobacteria bacterium]
MRAEIANTLEEARQSIALLRRYLDYDNAVKELASLNARAEDPNLWSKPAEAQRVMRERMRLEQGIGAHDGLTRELDDAEELLKLAEEEGDAGFVEEAEKTIVSVRERAGRLEIESLLSGEADANNCFLEVHAGAGGTESQDWAEILLRMYTRWAEAHGYRVDYIEESPGEEAGIKSGTLKVTGLNAYGWLKTESGVHRLVRISPFDSAARRHTSFASVWVYPEVDDSIDIEILDKDLRIDTYRASGAGGQHVNKTDSAIRITHLPTNIVVQCQTDRSQHRNRAAAMAMLRARLYERELQLREEAAEAARGQKSEIGWGSQIRSYVLQPYQMVKDLRTGVEKGNAQGVLDGDIDDFMAAALATRVTGGAKDARKVADLD